MKNVVIFAAIATILAVSGLSYTFIISETNRKSDENLSAEIQALNSDLTSLQNGLNTLNSSLTRLSQDLDNLDAELRSEIVSIQSNVSSVQTQISAIQNDVSAVQTDITNLQSNVTALSTQISNIQNDVSTIQASISDLQSTVASLEARVSTLETERPIVIRINFSSFIPDATPVTGEDYLFDAEVAGSEIYAQARTGHSRFIKPKYLDLVIRNGTRFIGTQVTIRIYAYWHLSDTLIDIDGETANYHLARTYTIGTVFQETVNGNNDGRGIIQDPYDATMTYKIETLL